MTGAAAAGRARARGAMWAATTVAAAVWVAASAGAARADTPGPVWAEAMRQAAPVCPLHVQHCLPLEVFVATRGGAPVQTAEWLQAQLSEANRHFAPLGVAFQALRVVPLPEEAADVRTREARDALGGRRVREGIIPVFVVGTLANVDAPGDINGVHWRQRGKPGRRWLIVASIARAYVLAHELGHYFGLKHSAYPISIMNKTPRAEPPAKDRTFAPEEIALMRSRLRALIRQRWRSPR